MIAIDRLRRELKLPASEEIDLLSILDELIGQWERETLGNWNRRVNFEQIIMSEQESGSIPKILTLSLAPVESIASVEIKYRMSDPTWTALQTTDWYLDQDKIRGRYAHLHRVNNCWPALTRVVYTGGWTDAPTGQQFGTPAEVVRACLIQARFIRARNDATKVAVNNQAFQGGSGSFHKPDLHPFFENMVKGYKRVV